MPRLDNIKHESFARLVAKGISKSKAYKLAGFASNNTGSATRLWRHMQASASIQRRVRELSKNSADLTAQDILDRILATYDLAFETEQCSAALKALELLGKERGLFRDRRENININLASMNWRDTCDYLRNQYGDRVEPLINTLRQHYGIDEQHLIEHIEE